METIVIIGQEALNLKALVKEIVSENCKVRVIDARKIKTAVISVNGIKIKASKFFQDSIKTNSVKCKTCGDIIESVFTYHSVRCSCGNCHIDGGRTELVHNISGPFEDLSEYYIPTT